MTWGADVDMDIPHLGTALYTACVCQELECARKLLREGQTLCTMWPFASLYIHAHALYEQTQTQEHTAYYKYKEINKQTHTWLHTHASEETADEQTDTAECNKK